MPIPADDALRYLPAVRKFAHQHAAQARWRGMEADDLVQAGTLALIETAQSFDPGHGITYWGWAKRHVRYAVWRALRQSKPLQHLPEVALAALPARHTERLRLDHDEVVSKCLKRLTGKERQVVESLFGLNGAEQVTARQLADRKGVTPQAVSATLHRALRRMRQYLRRQEEKRAMRHPRVAIPA